MGQIKASQPQVETSNTLVYTVTWTPYAGTPLPDPCLLTPRAARGSIQRYWGYDDTLELDFNEQAGRSPLSARSL